MKEIKGSLLGKGKKIAIVVSSFNEVISRNLLQGCIDTLKKCGTEDKDISIYWTPGAFEIPLICFKLSSSKKYDAIISLGAIIRGDTPHFDYIASSLMRSLQEISLKTHTPIILGVITAETEEQALERAGIKKENRGREAALAALEMANLNSKI